MEIHKPKPIHNWRELVTEIGVVVVGITIALSAEQFIQGLEWRHRIGRAEEQMRLEMAKDDGPAIFQRLAVSDCIDQGLAGIRASLERADSRSAVIEAISRVEIPRHTYESDAYHAAEASGVLAKLDPERLDRWNYLYAPVPVLDRIAEREFFDATNLHVIRSSGGPLSEAEQLRISEAVENLRRDNMAIVREARQAEQGLREHGVVLDGARMGQVMSELTGNPGMNSCAEKLNALIKRNQT
jgi:hypothetical protein